MQRGRLVGYFGFPTAKIRDTMLLHDWGKATVGIRDLNFAWHLDEAKKNTNIGNFNTGKDVGSGSPGEPSGC
jgi:hypothetical protein